MQWLGWDLRYIQQSWVQQGSCSRPQCLHHLYFLINNENGIYSIVCIITTVDLYAYRESRYLLFMTQNFAALRVLQQRLLEDEEQPPFVLFGSSFPKDMEYTQVIYKFSEFTFCRTILILLCTVVTLLNFVFLIIDLSCWYKFLCCGCKAFVCSTLLYLVAIIRSV